MVLLGIVPLVTFVPGGAEDWRDSIDGPATRMLGSTHLVHNFCLFVSANFLPTNRLRFL